MKVCAAELTDKERMKTLDALYTAAGSMRGRNAAKLFLRDLLTESERIMCGRRIIIARKLLIGATYEDIQQELRVGVDKIRRIHRWLSDQMPGYENAIKGMEQEFEKREKRSEAQKRWKTLKRKYPLLFLLFPGISK